MHLSNILLFHFIHGFFRAYKNLSRHRQSPDCTALFCLMQCPLTLLLRLVFAHSRMLDNKDIDNFYIPSKPVFPARSPVLHPVFPANTSAEMSLRHDTADFQRKLPLRFPEKPPLHITTFLFQERCIPYSPSKGLLPLSPDTRCPHTHRTGFQVKILPQSGTAVFSIPPNSLLLCCRISLNGFCLFHIT